MEREANLLRCAKLNCYAEFNSMVHAISRCHGGNDGCFQRLSKPKMIEGNSAEYFFYTTLVSMLNQVVRNTSTESQQVELQQIYQWFCINKPLISKKTNPKHQRPKLSLSSRPTTTDHQRPHTAPATNSNPHSCNIPPRPCTTDHTHSRTLHGFTSRYMSNSLSLSTQSDTAPNVSTIIPSSTVEHNVLRPNSRSGSNSLCSVSVIELPSEKRTSDDLNMSTLLHLAPSVAANMQWQREMHQAHLVERMPRLVREMSSTRQNTPDVTTVNSPPAIPTPSIPNTPQNNKPKSFDGRLHSSAAVHVLTLDIQPQFTTHTTSNRARRNVPTPLKRTGSKVGSGFKCSRYRSGSLLK